MKELKLLSLLFLAIVFVRCATAEETSWNLPLEINDTNTSVKFEVDSTWHLIHGTTSGLSGRVWLSDPTDYSSVVGEVKIPVSLFDTNNESRDKKMRKVMNEQTFREVKFSLKKIVDLCNPAEVLSGQKCAVKVTGALVIRGVSRDISFPASLEANNQRFNIKGEVSFNWSDFGVEDPSIIIAKLNKRVKVIIDLNF